MIDREPDFCDYFAYGSCMCPTDLQRTLQEAVEPYIVGMAKLVGYRLGFYYYAQHRNCGALDIVPDRDSTVHGVLYRLPTRLIPALDLREHGYRHELVNVPFNAAQPYLMSQISAGKSQREWCGQLPGQKKGR